MKFQLYTPLAIHEKGHRKKNEDNIYPALGEADTTRRIFLVCDGVGGEAMGEEASRLVCEAVAQYLTPKKEILPTDIQAAIRRAEVAMDEYILQHPNSTGMATTFTLLALHHGGATIAHIGDSRVYHIRQGKVLFATTDHSLVEELKAKQLITAQQALNHPNRNIITRAITGTQEPSDSEVSLITDVQAEDCFFLCTDGILESMEEGDLVALLGNESVSDTQKMQHIKEKGQKYSKDNFSAYLVRVRLIIK